MKKLLFIAALVLLVSGSLAGCGARRQAMTATAAAQALTATAMAQVPAVSTPRAEGVVLFQDDFQDGQPDGWQITAAWYVQQEGNVYYFSSSGQGGAWVPQGGNWADYEFQAAVRVTTGGAVLNYRMTGEGRYLLHFREDGLYLTKEYPKGSYTTLTQTAAPTLNAWHQVAVAGYGGHLQVYVDRVMQLDYTDPSPLLRGTIGVTTLEGSQAAVDDVLVTRLTTALPVPAPMALPPTVPPPAAPLSEEGGVPLEQIPPPEEGAPPPAPGLPVIDYFRSEPSERAGCYYLHWDLHEASAAYLNGEGVIAPDSREVCPEESGTYLYILRAENEAGGVEEAIAFKVGGTAGQPDLEIGNVSVWSPMPTDPGKVQIEMEVRNTGNGPAGAFTVRWYPHQASDVVGCSVDVAGLPANSGQILPCSYTYAERGEMHWRAVVDADNDIQDELREDNNEKSGTIRIEAGGGGQQPQPDLAIGAIAVNPSSPTMGGPAGVTVWFTNQGNAESGPFQVQWQSGEPPAAGVWCDWDVGSLQPGASDSRNCPYTYRNAGAFSMRVIVDSLNQVSESEEGNNSREQSITVVAAGPVGQPDLVVRDLMIIPDNTVKPGEQFGVTFRVQNNGNAPAGPSTAHWETATGAGLSCDCAVPEVGAGGSYRCDCSPLVAPSAPKNYGTWATADHGKVIAESDEGNNKSESAVLQVHQ